MERRESLRIVLLLCLLLGIRTFAADAPPASEPDYRFLFLIDSSFSMKTKKEAIIKTVGDLISTGFHNVAEEGDLLGIWTYSTHLRTGGFPPQLMTPQESHALADKAANFIDTLKFEGRNDLLPALIELHKYASRGRDMMVFLFCEGNEGVVGTLYDDDINRLFTEHRRTLERANKPFLVMFAYHKGEMNDASIYYGEGVVELPKLVRSAAPPTASKETPVIPPAVKSEPEKPREAAAAKPSITPPAQIAPEPKPEVRVAESVVQPLEKPAETPPARASQPAQPAQPAFAVPEIKIAQAPETKPAEPSPAPVKLSPELVKPPEPKPPVVEPKTVAPPVTSAPTPQQLPPQPKVEQQPVLVAQAKPSRPAGQNSPAPPVVAAPTSQNSQNTAGPANQQRQAATPAATNPPVPNPVVSKAETKPPATAADLPPPQGMAAYWPFGTAVVGLVALGVYWIWNRRRLAEHSKSLISQSFEK